MIMAIHKMLCSQLIDKIPQSLDNITLESNSLMKILLRGVGGGCLFLFYTTIFFSQKSKQSFPASL